MARCYLMDLERTIATGVPFYWKGSRYGYTVDLRQAGVFSREAAEKIIQQDFDKNTILIFEETIEKILGEGWKETSENKSRST